MSTGSVLVTQDRSRILLIERVREKLRARAIEISSGTLEQVLEVYEAARERATGR